MLSALAGDERLLAPRIEQERGRALSDSGGLRCPCCDAPVIFRAGARKIAHFAHKAGSDCPLEQDPDCRPESELHLTTKLALFDHVSASFPGAKVAVEVPIPETGQRADLLAEIDGRRIALEVQCTEIAGEAWRERHRLYRQAGIEDLWILTGHDLRCTVMPGSERHGLHPTFRLSLRDLAATVLEETGSIFLAWQGPLRRSPGSFLAEIDKGLGRRGGLRFAALDAVASHHGIGRKVASEPAGPWRERGRRERLVIGGGHVHAGPLAGCRLEPGLSLWVNDAHEQGHREAIAREARAVAEAAARG